MTKRRLLSTFIVTTLLSGCAENTPEDSSAARQAPQSLPEENGMPSYPSPDTWEHANERQRQRALRSFDQLKKRKVNAYSGPLFVEDDENVTLQSAQDAARRTLVLWAVELRAEGVPQEEVLEIIERHNLWESVSPNERRFLQADTLDPEECRELTWRLESIWVLLWALGHLEELDWPSDMCDVPRLVEILEPFESDSDFINSAKLRDKAEILDAQDLIMRLHWAVREAYLRGGGIIPIDLDWSRSGEMIPVPQSPAVGVIEQRHHTLNWLVNFGSPENWDLVDTPT